MGVDGCNVLPVAITVEAPASKVVKLSDNAYSVETSQPVQVVVKWVGGSWSGVLDPGKYYLVVITRDGVQVAELGAEVAPTCSSIPEMRGSAKLVVEVQGQEMSYTLRLDRVWRDAPRVNIASNGTCVTLYFAEPSHVVARTPEHGCVEDFTKSLTLCRFSTAEVWVNGFGPIRLIGPGPNVQPITPLTGIAVSMILIGLFTTFSIKRDLTEMLIGIVLFLVSMTILEASGILGLGPQLWAAIQALGVLTLVIAYIATR